jgi:hypothetical protein
LLIPLRVLLVQGPGQWGYNDKKGEMRLSEKCSVCVPETQEVLLRERRGATRMRAAGQFRVVREGVGGAVQTGLPKAAEFQEQADEVLVPGEGEKQ